MLITGDISAEQAQDIIDRDPYTLAGVASYQRVSFNAGIKARGLPDVFAPLRPHRERSSSEILALSAASTNPTPERTKERKRSPMSTVTAYAATSATEPLTKTTITRRDVGPHDVRFDIHFAGICHSDIHTVRAEWGQRYPVVPGHEIAGVVTEVGSQVTGHKVGDRVGVGCFVDSCRECDHCLAGLEQYCTGGGNIGTYNAIRARRPAHLRRLQRQHRRRRELYVLRIPDALGLDAAAPCCARASPPTRRCGTGMPGRAGGSPSWASAVWATWRSSSPRRWAPR